jgi:DNA mismatch repair protein MutS
MLQQYYAAKAEHPGVLMAIRVGDFYEFYGEDAETAATALEITLTGREDGENGRIPMAGVPHHALEKYLSRLIAKGFRVALCEQLEDPKTTKGLIKRGVTRVLTPGTLVEDSMLTASENCFLAAVCVMDGRAGLATLDPSTGEFAVTEVCGDGAVEAMLQELARVRPRELLVGPSGIELGELARTSLGAATSEVATPGADRAARRLMQQLGVGNLAGFGCEDKASAIVAAAMVLAYAEKNRLPLEHVETLSTYSVEGFMRLDPATRRALELTGSMSDGGRRHTLLGVLDETMTPMGARLLRRWIEQPLLDAVTIKARHEAVGRFVGASLLRGDLRDGLKRLADLERLVSRCAAGLATPRDLGALRSSLAALPVIAEPLRRLAEGRIQELREAMSDHGDLARLLEKAIVPEPPPTVREGGIVAPGYDPELDALRDLAKNGKTYIASLERDERERTGINSLKVGYNSVFGYYLEIGKAHHAKVPDHYVRKQTTANAERYITAELKEHESRVLGAEEKASALEADLFARIRTRVAEHRRSLLQTARALAECDALASLADVSVRRGYIRPEIVEEDVLEIASGRHPVVEASSPQGFVPNDVNLTPPLQVARLGEGAGGRGSGKDHEADQPGARVVILTGPNMAGKSTYLRQAALIVLMAQIGSFVPAKKCRMAICDRVFARIGAKDELALGQSTFMVEMVESANILNHATANSLVILDEVGRGTSTYDGLAIAWAMVEHLASIGAKTMFATHYHQLNALAGQVPGVANFRVAVEELGEDVVWTHRVLPGGTDRSYGIHVARMAGVPSVVLRRAQEVLSELEDKPSLPTPAPAKTMQLTLFEAVEPPVMEALRGVDPNALTPLEALRLLDDWKRKFK